MDNLVVILPVAFIILVLVAIAIASIKIVNQYERFLVFTLGRTSPNEVKGPGWVFIVPIAQRGVRVDLRERFIEIPSQTNITKDNAPINIDFLIYWRIVDPYRSIVEVQNFEGALQNIATTTLRAVIGDILLDDVLSKREQINEVLRAKMDEVTERWGGKVTTVEIREIIPPREVQDAMNRQLSAERTRRAVIIESEGSRQSAINVAEGTKQAEILKAEGAKYVIDTSEPDFKQKLVAACKQYLSAHPGTVFFACGTLQKELDRPVNDRQFDVALHVVFESLAAHDAYQDAPLHLKFVEENRANWKQVRVFDSAVEG